MKKFFFALLINLAHCTTTISPGILFSSTTEHVHLAGVNTTLGNGKIIDRVEVCKYSSVALHFFYYANLVNPYKIAQDSKIKKIGVIDYSSVNLLGPLVYKSCIIIWGEKE
jgi:hypothetical protein